MGLSTTFRGISEITKTRDTFSFTLNAKDAFPLEKIGNEVHGACFSLASFLREKLKATVSGFSNSIFSVPMHGFDQHCFVLGYSSDNKIIISDPALNKTNYLDQLPEYQLAVQQGQAVPDLAHASPFVKLHLRENDTESICLGLLNNSLTTPQAEYKDYILNLEMFLYNGIPRVALSHRHLYNLNQPVRLFKMPPHLDKYGLTEKMAEIESVLKSKTNQ